MKFVEPAPVPRQNTLLYGPPKSSKTTGACSAPGPLMLLNADLDNASWFARSRHPQIKEVDFEGLKTLHEIEAMVARPDYDGFLTIVTDPIGELYRRLLEELGRRAISPSLPTYQAVSVHIERYCRALCESPHVNAVFVCHEMPVKDDATNTVERLPATGTTNPTLGQKLMAMVDVVAYTGVIEREGEEPEYVGQLLNAKGRRGGDRSNSLGRVRRLDLGEWYTTMAAAMAAKNGAKAPEGDPT